MSLVARIRTEFNAAVIQRDKTIEEYILRQHLRQYILRTGPRNAWNKQLKMPEEQCGPDKMPSQTEIWSNVCANSCNMREIVLAILLPDYEFRIMQTIKQGFFLATTATNGLRQYGMQSSRSRLLDNKKPQK